MRKTSALGRRIKAYRMEHLITQVRMAAILGVGLRTLIRIEQGVAPGDLTRAKIDKLFQKESVAA